MNISIFLVCKCEGHFLNTYGQLQTTASVRCNNHTENKCVIVVLACYPTPALNFITVMNHTVEYRTFFAASDQ